MELLFFIGRLLYGGYFLKMGVNHFKNTDALTGYAGSKGVPKPRLAVLGGGVLLLLGGLGIVLGVYVQLAVLSLVIFLVPVSYKMHAYWNDTDPNIKMANMVNFQKNIALLGAALAFLAIPTPWALSF